MAEVKITIPTDLRKDIEDFGNNVNKYLSKTIRDEIVREYKNAVEHFYASYTPLYYRRKWQLRKSYRPLYKNPHKTKAHAGIIITPDRMKDVHKDDNATVLGYALEGWHGNPVRGIFTTPAIYSHIQKYRDIVFSNIDSYAGDCVAKAKKENYRILRF